MLSRNESYWLGSAASCFLSWIISFGFGLGIFSFAVAAIHGVCAVVAWVRLAASSNYQKMSVRGTFILPFVPYFLAPLWLAVVAIVYGWWEARPNLLHPAVFGLFILQVVSLLVFVRLADSKPSKG